MNLENFSDVRGRGSLAREYVITYRDHLEPNEHLIQGTFWSADVNGGTAPRPEVSVEEGIHDRFNINIGDEMRFETQLLDEHRRLTAEVSIAAKALRERVSGDRRAAIGSIV